MVLEEGGKEKKKEKRRKNSLSEFSKRKRADKEGGAGTETGDGPWKPRKATGAAERGVQEAQGGGGQERSHPRSLSGEKTQLKVRFPKNYKGLQGDGRRESDRQGELAKENADKWDGGSTLEDDWEKGRTGGARAKKKISFGHQKALGTTLHLRRGVVAGKEEKRKGRNEFRSEKTGDGEIVARGGGKQDIWGSSTEKGGGYRG